MSKLIFEQETYEIIGACMEIHRILGPELLEIVYQDALEYELDSRNILYTREQKFEVVYKDIVLLHFFIADFIVFDDIVLEVKATSSIIDSHIAQTLNYMKLVNGQVGLIINFGTDRLQYKRLVR